MFISLCITTLFFVVDHNLTLINANFIGGLDVQKYKNNRGFISNMYSKIQESFIINEKTNNCVTFTIGHTITCPMMCRFCSNTLRQLHFYFTDNVCMNRGDVRCVGYPVPGMNYTCCSI